MPTALDMVNRLSINQYTVRQWSIPELLDGCAKLGIPYVALWRDKLREIGIREATRLLNDSGIRVSSLCRGGFFPWSNQSQRAKILADNRRAIDEAAALGTEVLVLVCGGIANRNLGLSRQMIEESLAQMLPYAAGAGVKLGIEPLHPMFCAERSVIVSLHQANRIVETLKSRHLGVVIDVYHVWWDPEVFTEIERAKGHILGFHVNDWIVPVPDFLNGRGMMGDGAIDLRGLRRATEAAGYQGPIEVEIFNQSLWELPGEEVLALTKERYLTQV